LSAAGCFRYRQSVGPLYPLHAAPHGILLQEGFVFTRLGAFTKHTRMRKRKYSLPDLPHAAEKLDPARPCLDQ
jgi:hypothetical protein